MIRPPLDRFYLLTILVLAVFWVVACVPKYTFYTPEDFQLTCQQAHVRFFKPPSAPVTSVLWQRAPEDTIRKKIQYHGYVIKNNKHLVASGTALDGWQPFLQDYVPVYEPLSQWESDRLRKERGQSVMKTPLFLKKYKKEMENGVESIRFDVKVTYTVGPDSVFKYAVARMPMARHSVEVTDLRTDELLAEMTYFIDKERGLACGENIPGQANMDVFALQATNLMQNVLPSAKNWVRPTTRYEQH